MIMSRLNQSKLWKLHLVDTYYSIQLLPMFMILRNIVQNCSLDSFICEVCIIEHSDFIFSSQATSVASNDQGSEIQGLIFGTLLFWTCLNLKVKDFPNWSRLLRMGLSTYALSKTVLVSPKWFWSDQIGLDLTKMKWSRPK